MKATDNSPTVSEQLASVIARLPRAVPAATTAVCESLLIDVAGICISARRSDFMQATLAATDEAGACTVIAMRRGAVADRGHAEAASVRLADVPQSES